MTVKTLIDALQAAVAAGLSRDSEIVPIGPFRGEAVLVTPMPGNRVMIRGAANQEAAQGLERMAGGSGGH